jgi:hypothetical protein
MERMGLQQELYGSRFTASLVQGKIGTIHITTVIPTISLSYVITTISVPLM